MYAGSLESTRYLLLTEFEGRTACNRTSFFRSDLWPKHKVRRSHKLSRKNMLVLTVSTYVIEQERELVVHCITFCKDAMPGKTSF